jgi:ribosomal protein L7/L12
MTDDENLAAELIELLANGRKIEAIKRYRDATGANLAQAKEIIDGLEQGVGLPTPMPLDPTVEREIVTLLEQGKKIAAIKVYREATGARLKQAKEAVEAIAERHGFTRLAKSGCLTLLSALIITVGIFGGLL